MVSGETQRTLGATGGAQTVLGACQTLLGGAQTALGAC